MNLIGQFFWLVHWAYKSSPELLSQNLGHKKFIVHENEDPSCESWHENEAAILER